MRGRKFVYRTNVTLDINTAEKLFKISNVTEMKITAIIAEAINKLYNSEEMQQLFREENEKRKEAEVYND